MPHNPNRAALVLLSLLLAVAAAPLLVGRGEQPNPYPAGAAQDSAWTVPGEIVVDLRDDIPASGISALAGELGLSFSPFDLSGNAGRILTAHAEVSQIPGLLQKLRTDPRVEAAEPERLFRIPAGDSIPSLSISGSGTYEPQPGKGWTPNDPRYSEQWNFNNIRMQAAWPITHGKGAVVAVIDTGVAFQDSTRGKRAKDFGATQFAAPYDFVHRDRNPYDDNGHGTHVAGTIAESTNNGEGVAGIAFEAKIMPLKVLSAYGSGRMSDVAAAIRYAADNGAHIINMSLGSPFPDAVTRNACQYARRKGVTIVCAAGNSGGEGVSYPAAYPDCIAVSALGPKSALAPYSSWGKAVAISAPGGDKSLGEEAGILQNTVYDGEDGYFAFQGTSMATPHVAGVAALIVAQGVKEPSEVRAILEKTASPLGDRAKFGAGQLNAEAAAKQAGGVGAGAVTQLWLINILWLWCAVEGIRGSRSRRAIAVGSALAVTVGLVFPDLVAAYAGFGSTWNLIGHSALLPLGLLLSEAKNRPERHFFGLLALGLTIHIGTDLWTGAAPLIGTVSWAALPWLWLNVGLGAAAFMRTRR